METRSLLSCSAISGYAYYDVNNNGLLDAGESVLPNTHIVLKNSSGAVVGATDTDAQGFYQFDSDSTIDTSEHTLQTDFTIADTTTNWSIAKSVAQFDPSLGTLTSIEIKQSGTITSDFFFENTSNSPLPNPLSGTISGTLTLSGAGFSLPVSPLGATGEFTATAFDGVLNFAGTSGHDFGPQSASASTSLTITDPSVLALYTGTGTVSITQNAVATSAFHGSTGNEVSGVFTSASASYSVIYHYIPNNCLQPGTYTLHETQPSNYLDGQDTAGNVTPLPNSAGGPDDISVTVVPGTPDYPNNNFGELLPASLGDRVWFDSNSNGVQDAGESGFPDVTVTLSNGQTTTTDSDGNYRFTNLAPGSYSVTFAAPDGFSFTTTNATTDALDSDADVATGSTASYTLAPGQYNDTVDAGLVAVVEAGPSPASLSGYVYVDFNNDGLIDSNEPPIAGVTVTLTGTDTLNQAVSATTTTDADGYYEFTDLAPGTYQLAETQPASYLDGKDTLGTIDDVVVGSKPLNSNDLFSQISLAGGQSGIQYNFGELPPVGSHLAHGMTATIGYWQNKNGQALIKSLNGGPSSTQLSSWLSTTFPNLYGPSAGAHDLSGKTNAGVADFYLTLFKVKGQKLDAQVLCTALAVYVTNSSLAGGTDAASYGFTVSSFGTGSATYNVGSSGSAFGTANNSTLTIMQILLAANDSAVNGSLYNGNTALSNAANTVFNGINTNGDI